MITTDRTDDDLNAVYNEAMEADDGGSRYPGMSYEDGVRAVIEWLQADAGFEADEAHPFEDG